MENCTYLIWVTILQVSSPPFDVCQVSWSSRKKFFFHMLVTQRVSFHLLLYFWAFSVSCRLHLLTELQPIWSHLCSWVWVWHNLLRDFGNDHWTGIHASSTQPYSKYKKIVKDIIFSRCPSYNQFHPAGTNPNSNQSVTHYHITNFQCMHH